jgi:tRNA-splicing ligase RtcB
LSGLTPVRAVSNHHNFAWKENHGGREVLVHRKGATPAGAGVLGVIPGSMGTPGFLVRGRGATDSRTHALTHGSRFRPDLPAGTGAALPRRRHGAV